MDGVALESCYEDVDDSVACYEAEDTPIEAVQGARGDTFEDAVVESEN